MSTISTQVAHPWSATLRTVVQSVAGVILTGASIIAGLAVFAPQFLDAIQAALPPEWAPYAVSIVAVIGVVSGAVARVMAIPGVNEWLTKLKLAAAGKHAA